MRQYEGHNMPCDIFSINITGSYFLLLSKFRGFRDVLFPSQVLSPQNWGGGLKKV